MAARTRFALRTPWTTVAGILILLCGNTYLFAHATLVRTEPGSGAILAKSPPRVRLEFSEPIEAEFNGIAIYNTGGIRMDLGNAERDPADVRAVRMPVDDLAPGVYTVVWHVLSADGHPIEGAYGFVVGTASGGPQLTIPSSPSWKTWLIPPAGLVHAVAILGMLLLTGIPLSYWLMLRPAYLIPGAAPRDAELQQALVRVLNLALLFAVVASALSLLLEAVRISGAPQATVSGSLLFRVASRTRFGQMWSLRMLGLAGTAVLVWRLSRNRERRWSPGQWAPPAAVSALLLLTPGLGGHPAAAGKAAVVLVASDWLHLLAAAPWVAGLWVLVFVVPKLAPHAGVLEKARLALTLVDRFPRIAVASVVLVVASGVLAAVKHVPTWYGLLNTGYGQAILSKSALLLIVLALAAAHHLVFKVQARRWIEIGNHERTSQVLATFRRTVGLELGLVAAILIAAGVLVNLPPAEASLAASAGQWFEESQQTPAVRLTLRVRPARVGLNSVEIGIEPREGLAAVEPLQFTLTTRMLAHDMGQQEITLHRVSKGRFGSDHLMFGMSGPWELRVLASLDDGREIQGTFHLYVPDAEQDR